MICNMLYIILCYMIYILTYQYVIISAIEPILMPDNITYSYNMLYNI